MHVLRLLLLVLGLAVLSSAMAQDVGRFEGETPVASQDPAERAAALPRALAQLLVKLSGDPRAGDDPALREPLERAPALMQQYRYRQLEMPSGDSRLSLIASFDRAAVEAMLAAAGNRIWPEPRPVPVVWLAIDDGRGPRLVGHAHAQAVAPLSARARQRGLRLSYPLLDLEDQQQIDVGAVWNLDPARIAAATQRYQSQVALVGRLYRSGGGWSAEWRVLDRGETIGHQRLADSAAAPLLAAGADLAADSLAQRYFAQLFDAGPSGRYDVWIEQVGSAQDYARALGYLQGLPIVRAAVPQRALGDRLLVELDLSTGVEGLARLVAGAGTLEPLPAGPGERERRFRLEP